MKDMSKVCDDARKRVSKMNLKQRLELSMKVRLLAQNYLKAAQYRDMLRKIDNLNN